MLCIVRGVQLACKKVCVQACTWLLLPEGLSETSRFIMEGHRLTVPIEIQKRKGDVKMARFEDLRNSTVFRKGDAMELPVFSGEVWLHMLSERDSTFNCPIGNVTFAPGCRNNWHRHPGGQILLVTGGQGYYQAEGEPVQELRLGDVVRIPPDVKHWHGAATDSWFVHLSVETNPQAGPVQWLEPVSDEDYNQLK